MDINEFRRRGYETVDRVARYYEKELEEFRVLSNVEPGYLAKLLPSNAPEDPEDFSNIQKDFDDKIIPGITHWQSPNFFAFFPSNSSFPGILADMYSDMVGVIGFNWQTSPACTELETIVLDWMAQLMGLDALFHSRNINPSARGGGSIQGSASEAVMVAVVAACDRAARLHQATTGCDDDAVRVFKSRLVAYGSSQTHSCTQKACNVTNLRFRKIETGPETGYALTGEAVRRAMEEDRAAGLVPFFVTTTIGSTSCGVVDDIPSICDAVAGSGIWVHVDAAWAGVATVCPEFRHHLVGTDRVDSLSTNMHKWGLTNFDCCCFWVKDSSALVDAMSLTPPFLRNQQSDAGLVIDYRDWQLPLGRRFRSLKMWFVLRTFGAKGLREHVRKHVAQCHHFQTLLLSQPTLFKLITPPAFALLTFQITPPPSSTLTPNELTKRTYDAVNASGKIMVTYTVLEPDMTVIRFVPGSAWTTDKHVEGAFDVIVEFAKKVLEEC